MKSVIFFQYPWRFWRERLSESERADFFRRYSDEAEPIGWLSGTLCGTWNDQVPPLSRIFWQGTGRQTRCPTLRRGEQLAPSFFGHPADGTQQGERSRWLSLPHQPREVNRRVASPVGPEKLFATLRAPPLPLRGRQAAASPKSPLRFRRRPDRDLDQRFAGDSKGINASRPENPG